MGGYLQKQRPGRQGQIRPSSFMKLIQPLSNKPATGGAPGFVTSEAQSIRFACSVTTICAGAAEPVAGREANGADAPRSAGTVRILPL